MVISGSGNVAQAVAGSLGTGQGTAERDALAGQDAGVLVADALVLAKQEADLTACATLPRKCWLMLARALRASVWERNPGKS